MTFLLIILIGIVIYQLRKIEDLNAKIFHLQKELKKYQDNNSEDVQDIQQDKKVIQKSTKIKSKVKIDSTSSKNLSILITGSVLIVLAAIVFLTTAWQSIPDFIKTIVLFLVALVFIGASKISKEKYNLEKASKTFFYIGMAYLPICFLSISIFGLFGTYLSVNGDGKYIYLEISTLVLAVLYYFISKKSDDRYLFYGSLLSQILSVILFTLMFEERLFLVFINLLLYNLLLMLVTKDKLFEIIITIIPAGIAIGSIMGLEDEIGSWYFIFTSLLLAINFMCLELKKSHMAKSILFNLFLLVFGFSLIFKESFKLSDGTCQVLATLFTGTIFVLENLIFVSLKENKNLLISARLSALISMSYLYIGTLIEADKMVIPSYVIAIILEALLVYDLKLSKNSIYKYLAYAFTNILLVDIHNKLFNDFELTNYIPMLTTTIFMIYEMYSTRECDNFLQIYLAGFEALALCFVAYNGKEVGSILAIIFTIFALYYNKKTNAHQIFNAIPLLCALPCILETGLNKELELGILLLSTIGLGYISVTSEEINVYTIISGIYLVITCNKINSNYFEELLYIAWGMMHVYFYKNEKSKDLFKILTTISVITLYYTVAEDLKILEFTLFELLGVVVSGMYIIKFVIAKYYKETDVVEYLFWAIIYLYAIANYVDSRDGILFSVLIIAIIFYSYYKKYGATFLAGIIAILVNAFALTKEFWFSIPWWIYLLAVGGILVGFAIKNEANENKEKISVGSVLKGIKDKIEKE